MKKLLLISALFASVIVLSYSCRKGANDPFLSIRSRDSRIVGTWEIKNILIDSTVTISSSLKQEDKTYLTSFKDDSLKIFSDPNGNTKDSVYKEVLIINEDGTYIDSVSSKKNGTSLSKLRVIKNFWYWTESKKNKDGIVLVGFGTFRVDRLAWKELILISYKQSVNYSNKSLAYGSNITVSKELKYKRN